MVLSLRSYKGVWRIALLAGVLQACYAGVFIYQSSCVVEGERYFCLFDDAMISMRYAANWADGHGFVWNTDEQVEGYTNFGWTAIMGLCHLLGLSLSHTCLLVQCLGILALWGCSVGTILLARACRLAPIAACCALALAITQYNLIYYALMGMETGLLTVLVTLGLRESVVAIRRREGRIAPALWFAGAVLVRPDAMLLLLVSVGFLLVAAPRKRWRTILGLLIVAAVVSVHLLWRYHFYGDWLPNTYYLKATGWAFADRIPVGLYAGSRTMTALGLPFLLGVCAFAVALMTSRTPQPWQLLLAGAFLVTLAYDVYVGGDAWPNGYRFELPTTIGLMVLAGEGIYRLTRFLTKPAVGRRVCWVLTVGGMVAINYINLDHWLLRLPPSGSPGNRTNIMHVLAAEEVADADATAAVVWAGAFPYFSGRQCFDLLGKCDPHVARLPAHPEVKIAGHNKFDSEYTVSTHRPDIVVGGLQIMYPEFFKTYRPIRVTLDGAELTLSVRKASGKISGGERISWSAAQRIHRNTPRF